MITSIIRSNSGHIYVEDQKNILHLEILNEQYNKDEFIQLCSTLKMFLEAALIKKVKYYIIFHTDKLGVYPLSCYTIVKDTLDELKPTLEKVLHCSCVLVEPNFTSHILKFFFSIYQPVRPATVITDVKEASAFFSKDENQNTYNL